MLQHVATSNQVKFECPAILEGSERANSRRSLDTGDVIDIGCGAGDKAIEQVTAVTAEIENGFDVSGDVLLKDFGQRCAPLLHGSGREPSVEILRVPRLATLAKSLILRASVVAVESGFFVRLKTGFGERKVATPTI